MLSVVRSPLALESRYAETSTLKSFPTSGCSYGSVVRALHYQRKCCGFNSQGTHILTKKYIKNYKKASAIYVSVLGLNVARLPLVSESHSAEASALQSSAWAVLCAGSFLSLTSCL